MPELKAPFPYFGGKSMIAERVWQLFGSCQNYVEPFFGSGAMLLSRPKHQGNETVNDINGYIANFWRSIRYSPEDTAEHADWPVNENDLHARHVWLIQQKESMGPKLEGDPEWHDPKIAGWWVWGICNWIGGGWCDDKTGPWWVEDGKLVKAEDTKGVSRKLVHLGDSGRGVSRKRVHLGDSGRGVSRRLVHLGNNGIGVSRKLVHLGEWFQALSDRLRRVRVCCGDWSRVCGPSVMTVHGMTAVFLDPPYAESVGRHMGCYGDHDDGDVSQDVLAWCRENGDNPLLRIVLCGYEGEHELPGWRCEPWKANGGYGVSNGNEHRERLWISPHCVQDRQKSLF